MRLGDRHHTYRLVPDWAKTPADVRLGYSHWVAVDNRGRVIVLNQSKHAVALFDRDGRWLGSWGAEFARGAHGLFLADEAGEQFLWVVDYALPRVAKFTLDGREVQRLATPDHPEYPGGAGYTPTHACVAPNGDIYVFDGYGKSLIHRFSPGGRLLQSWGGAGEEPGRMRCPHGGCVIVRPGAEAELYVADRANVRIQVFTLDGVHKRFIAGRGLKYPCNVYAAPGGEILIPDLFGVLLVWDSQDRLVTAIGANPEIPEVGGWPRLRGYPNLPHDRRVPGTFIAPHGTCVDPKTGDVYVVEWVDDSRITKLERVAEAAATTR
jgi:DNA-binding beta-propeller fold protein YncE